MGTKNNPGQYDCYANAAPDEPMFVLLGRDRLAPSLVQLWIEARISLGENSDKIEEARTCVDAMKQHLFQMRKQRVDALDCLPFNMLADALRKRGATVVAAQHGGNGSS